MKLMTLKTVAQEHSISIHTLRKFARIGMPHYKVGRKIFVDQQQFESWFATQFTGDKDGDKKDLAQIVDEAVSAVMK
jgi:hypothetical protein